ncbi:RicAFT regulatory complex protein RicA family protein [Kyrpidia spormannii]|uniref:YlbF family regulator n=2 Tax=Kyrpidia spormannii TaxID=2055160 RepID=A0ACA8Z830_9BACL|nr:YlbF family regulator [Kyrpidia spormannii]CAB3391700.1 YlbF family regulator [Kyrpidia spormannii]CAB3392613.1 YlbF family regulator [Kyrpidia spormannii]
MALDVNELWAQAYELGLLIADSSEIEAYRLAEKALGENAEAQALMRELREQQEQLDRLRAYGSGQHLRPLEESIEEILKALDAIPEVVAFKNAQQQVNDLLKEVTRTILSAMQDPPEPPPGPRDCGCD